MGRRAGQDPKPESAQQHRKARGREEKDTWIMPKYKPDTCPPGYEPKIWDLTLLFHQLAEKNNIQLQVGPVLTYSKLERRMIELAQRIRSDKDSGKGSWSVDGITRFSSWETIGRAAIRREWYGYVQDEYAADWFCSKVRFWEVVEEVRQRGYRKHLASLSTPETKEDDSPALFREPMRHSTCRTASRSTPEDLQKAEAEFRVWSQDPARPSLRERWEAGKASRVIV